MQFLNSQNLINCPTKGEENEIWTIFKDPI